VRFDLTLRANLAFLGKGQYCSFSFVNRERVESLPEPFRAGVESSGLWKKEKEREGLAITNCLSIYIPETENKDVLFLVRTGYQDGWNIFNLLGFGDAIFGDGDKGDSSDG
jgi:hypothetical protein